MRGRKWTTRGEQRVNKVGKRGLGEGGQQLMNEAGGGVEERVE